MGQKEIEQSFISAGWELDGSFADDLIIGYDGDHLSILADLEVWESENPAFEIIDHERNITYWVQEMLYLLGKGFVKVYSCIIFIKNNVF